MTEILDNLYTSKILLMSYKFRFSDLVEKLMRMTFSGDYAQGPSAEIKFIEDAQKEAGSQINSCDSDFDWDCGEEW